MGVKIVPSQQIISLATAASGTLKIRTNQLNETGFLFACVIF
jgi:hypothetical protein